MIPKKIEKLRNVENMEETFAIIIYAFLETFFYLFGGFYTVSQQCMFYHGF